MAQSVLMQLLLEIRQFRQAWEQAATAAQQGAQRISRQAQAGGRAMDQASKKATGFAGAIEFLKKRVIGAGLFFAAFYQGLITFRQLVGDVVSEFFNLDDALRRVQSITGDSDREIARLRDNLIDLAKNGELFDQTASDVADSMFEISQAGFSSSEALQLAKLAAEGAAVGFTRADTAARVLVGVLKAYDLPVSKARDVMDVLFQTVDTGIITFEDLATNLGRVLSSSAALSVPLEEVNAAIATLTLRGFTADQAMTSVNRIMQTFVRPSQRARDAANELGIALNADTIAADGFVATLERMFVASGGNVNKFAEMFDRIQSTRGAISLFSDDGVLLTSVLEEMGGATEGVGRMAEAMEQRSKSLKFQFAVLRAQVLAVTTDAMEPLAGALASVLASMNNILSGKNPFFNFFADLDSLVVALIATFVFMKRQAIHQIFTNIAFQIQFMRLQAAESVASVGLLRSAMAGLGGVLKAIGPGLVFLGTFALLKFGEQMGPLAGMAEEAAREVSRFEEALTGLKELADAGIITEEELRARAIEEELRSIVDEVENNFAPRLAKAADDFNSDVTGEIGEAVSNIGRLLKGDLRADTEVVADDFEDFINNMIDRIRELNLTSDDLDLIRRRLSVLSQTAEDDKVAELYRNAAQQVSVMVDETGQVEDALNRAAQEGSGLADTFGDSLIVASDVREAIEKWLQPIEDAKGLMEDILGLTSQQDIQLRAQIAPIEVEIAQRNAEIERLKGEQIKRAEELGIPLSEIDESEDGILTTLRDQIGALDEQNNKDQNIIDQLEARLEVEEKIDSNLQAQLDLLGLQEGKMPALLSLTDEQQRTLAIIVGIMQEGGIPALEEWIIKEKEAGRVLDDEVLAALLEVVGNLDDNELQLDVSQALSDLGLIEQEAERISGREFHIRFVQEMRRRQRGAQHGIRNFVGGLLRVGEAGEELVRLPRGSDVIPRANIGPALRDQQRRASPSLSAHAEVNITTSLLKDFLTLKEAVIKAVEERMDEAAARAGMANPRFGTFGAGVPRV